MVCFRAYGATGTPSWVINVYQMFANCTANLYKTKFYPYQYQGDDNSIRLFTIDDKMGQTYQVK